MTRQDYKKLAAKHMGQPLYDLNDVDRLVRALDGWWLNSYLRDRLQEHGLVFWVSDLQEYCPSLNPTFHGMNDNDSFYPRDTVRHMLMTFWPSKEERIDKILSSSRLGNNGIAPFPASNGRKRGLGYHGTS